MKLNKKTKPKDLSGHPKGDQKRSGYQAQSIRYAVLPSYQVEWPVVLQLRSQGFDVLLVSS